MRQPMVNDATGIVVNVIEADETFAAPEGFTLVPSETANIGDHYDGSVFTAPPEPEPAPPTTAELLAAAGRKQDAVLAQVWTFDVGASAPLTTRLDAGGQAAMMQLLAWAKLLAGPDDVQHYNQADGTPGPDITPAEATALAAHAGAIKSETFKALNDIAGEITASPPTITTIAQIDAFAWPAPAAA